MEVTDLRAAVAARWCRKHKAPELPQEARAAIHKLTEIVLAAIDDAPESPPPEVRDYYQSMKFLLLVAQEQARLTG